MSGRKKSTKMNEPSFSSTLLDEIYRSIDQPAENSKFYSKKPARMNRRCILNEGEEDKLRIEKWMEKGYNNCKDKFLDSDSNYSVNDVLFSTTSSSSCNSDTSSGGLSSSDTDQYFGGSLPPIAVSCFSQLKPVKTGGIIIRNKQQETTNKNNKSARSKPSNDNFRKEKKQQPISPGGRLTSFINSLFTNSAKSKKHQDRSFKSSTGTAGKQSTSRINDFQDYGKLKWDVIRDVNGRVYLDQRNVNHHLAAAAEEVVSSSCRRVNREDEDDDWLSDSSSDLFELDHLSFFGNKRFCEELPVYETTHLGSVVL